MNFLIFVIALQRTLTCHFILPSAVCANGNEFPSSINTHVSFDFFYFCCSSLFIRARVPATRIDTVSLASAVMLVIIVLNCAIDADLPGQNRAFTLNYSRFVGPLHRVSIFRAFTI